MKRETSYVKIKSSLSKKKKVSCFLRKQLMVETKREKGGKTANKKEHSLRGVLLNHKMRTIFVTFFFPVLILMFTVFLSFSLKQQKDAFLSNKLIEYQAVILFLVFFVADNVIRTRKCSRSNDVAAPCSRRLKRFCSF